METGEEYEFISTNMKLAASTIATICKSCGITNFFSMDQAEPEYQVSSRNQLKRRIGEDLGGRVLLPAFILHQVPD
jgi:hypothetical protein